MGKIGWWVAVLVVTLAAFQSSVMAKSEEEKLQELRNAIGVLSKQAMSQQLYVEEIIRKAGNSGLNKVRATIEGTRNYHSASHINQHAVAAIHDHSNNIRVVGLGELNIVLNGINFQTRHNDYMLVQPNTQNNWYHVVENITYPAVPPAVLQKPTVTQQIEEMQEWFRAWADQDYSVRDYRPYFKPIICYLEGAFTTTGNEIDNDFDSDRHHLEAATWFELQEKIRFTAANGRKSINENFAYMPTTIIDIVNDTYPIYGQWNYRILCAPVRNDIPLNRLRVRDDLVYRMAKNVEYENVGATRAARYQLNPVDSDEWAEGPIDHTFLDELMEQIPGKNNYVTFQLDEGIDGMAQRWNEDKDLNAGWYHRWFRAPSEGILGTKSRFRSFSDENLFYALNSRPQIAPIEFTKCDANGQNCATYRQKMSFALPLEIIYMTPLYEWNPYNIEFKGNSNHWWGAMVNEGQRNGGLTPERAYNGSNNRIYYRTPAEFFNSGVSDGDAADTSQGIVGALDKDGDMHLTVASGTYIHFPEIEGIGILRQRYPIMPVHGEGTTEWKELEALKDIVLQSQTYGDMKRE